MSYILDALNKSEQERERKQTPGLKNLRGEAAPSRFQTRHFVYLLAILVTFNVIGVFFYFGKNTYPETGIPPQVKNPSTDALVAASRAPIERFSPPAQETSIPSSSFTTNYEPPRPSSSFTTARPNRFTAPVAKGKIVGINDLPGNVIRRLPELKFTAHIFASDPDLRMVNINGVSRREGDLVTDLLLLVEITEVGVVLNYEDYSFLVDILEDWQNDP